MSWLNNMWSSFGLKIFAGVAVTAGIALLAMWGTIQAQSKHIQNLDHKLEKAEAQVRSQAAAIEAMHRVEREDRQTHQEEQHAHEEITQAEGASQPVPVDVAAAWGAGIDSLRAQAGNSPSV